MEEKNYALVTGASTGIGRAIAEELAARKHNLILNSLPGQGLSVVCEELANKHGIHAIYYEIDLTIKEGPQFLYEFVKSKSCKVDMLVNNAGIGFDGPIESYSVEEIDYMIFLNIRALTLITHFFTPELKKRRKAYVLNISSFGCYLPTAFKSVYLASKSYIYYFTRALDSEFRGTSVSTCIFTPATVKTNPNVLDRMERAGWFGKRTALDPEEVASEGVRGMLKGKKVIIPGTINRLFFSFGLFVPLGILMVLTHNIFRNYHGEKL